MKVQLVRWQTERVETKARPDKSLLPIEKGAEEEAYEKCIENDGRFSDRTKKKENSWSNQ
jgi:hypothetical protein